MTDAQDSPSPSSGAAAADMGSPAMAHVSPRTANTEAFGEAPNAAREARAVPVADPQVRPTKTQVSPATVQAEGNVQAEAVGGTGEVATAAAQQSTVPELPLRDIELLLRRGKALEEARRELLSRLEKQKNQPPEEPVHYAQPPGPTEPLYGPAEPPLTLSSCHNLRPPPGFNSLG